MTQAGGRSDNVRRITLWPRGLVGRVTCVLLAAVALVFLVSSAFYEEAETFTVDDSHFDRIGERLAVDARVLAAAPREQRPVLATMLSKAELAIDWRPSVSGHERTYPSPSLDNLHDRLVEAGDGLSGDALQLSLVPGSATDVRGIWHLPDGSIISFLAPDILRRHHVTRGLASAAIVAGAVLLAAVMMVQTLSTPLRALAAVADGVGDGEWVPLDATGPREIANLARAINAMQVRIQKLIRDRTEALAAVSHDLRTPLARLRLRAGFLEDQELQSSIESDVAEMEAMVGGVLAYLSGENDPEKPRSVDIASMLMTLVDDYADQGRPASYDGPDHASVSMRALAMKRVFVNLINNALAYGGSAQVSLRDLGDRVVMAVEDQGPGIPEEELERVLIPFVRLEGSRSRATGGLGLGLAIVQREVMREGAVLALKNRAAGGLRVEVTLRRAGIEETSSRTIGR